MLGEGRPPRSPRAGLPWRRSCRHPAVVEAPQIPRGSRPFLDVAGLRDPVESQMASSMASAIRSRATPDRTGRPRRTAAQTAKTRGSARVRAPRTAHSSTTGSSSPTAASTVGAHRTPPASSARRSARPPRPDIALRGTSSAVAGPGAYGGGRRNVLDRPRPVTRTSPGTGRSTGRPDRSRREAVHSRQLTARSRAGVTLRRPPVHAVGANCGRRGGEVAARHRPLGPARAGLPGRNVPVQAVRLRRRGSAAASVGRAPRRLVGDGDRSGRRS